MRRRGGGTGITREEIPLAGVVVVDSESLESRDLGREPGLALLILIRHRF